MTSDPPNLLIVVFPQTRLFFSSVLFHSNAWDFLHLVICDFVLTRVSFYLTPLLSPFHWLFFPCFLEFSSVKTHLIFTLYFVLWGSEQSVLFVIVTGLQNFLFYLSLSISLQACISNCLHRNAISMFHSPLKGIHANPNVQSLSPPKQLLLCCPTSLSTVTRKLQDSGSSLFSVHSMAENLPSLVESVYILCISTNFLGDLASNYLSLEFFPSNCY